jgi:hypothetical protein
MPPVPAEFGLDTLVIIADAEGRSARDDGDELLPGSFRPEDLLKVLCWKAQYIVPYRLDGGFRDFRRRLANWQDLIDIKMDAAMFVIAAYDVFSNCAARC